jgi:hypothetical protein
VTTQPSRCPASTVQGRPATLRFQRVPAVSTV